MHEENAEKTKASRHLRILIALIIVGVGLPLILFFSMHVRSAP
jgi:hypothetical protein